MPRQATIECARWDLTPFFPAFQGPEYTKFFAQCQNEVQHLLEKSTALGAVTDANLESWVEVFLGTEELGARLSHLGCYLECLLAQDTTVEAVRAEVSRQSDLSAEMEKVGVRLEAALKSISDEQFEALASHPKLAEARFHLEELRRRARHTMEAELEALAADLSVDGFHAWGRLYTNLAGAMEFDLVEGDGTLRQVPMSLKMSLLDHPDPRVRKATLEGSNAAWQRMETVTAACLNALAGTRLRLYERRGIGHFLEAALQDACLSRPTLDAMMGVLAEKKQLAQDYLRLKARLMGKARLGFQDIYAPLQFGQESGRIPWSEARARVLDSFEAFYPELARYARTAFEQNWIDTEPRAGRSPGGFCSGSPVLNETRIFMTFSETAGDVMTLAHELGHGFHEWVVRDLRPWQRQYPMTLAETASTFAEAVYTESVLKDPATTPVGQAMLLDRRLEAAAAYMVNIPMRFFFEKSFYEERANGEVSVSRIKELMVQAERDWYGDTLAEHELDPYFWASKLHFYITQVSFYNFPYSFGYLFSSAVFERALTEGPSFLPRYEELLRLTGSDTCEGVARRALGADLGEAEFWHAALRSVERDLQSFQRVVQEEALRPGPS